MFWRPYTEKRQNPLSDYREGDTALHSITPLRAQSSYDGENLACSSIVVGPPNNEERSPKVASGRKHGAVSDNTYFSPIIAVSEFQLWKAIAPEPSNGGTPNFQPEVRRVSTIDRSPRPLPVIYALGASASEYTWWPIISGLLYRLETRCESLRGFRNRGGGACRNANAKPTQLRN